MRPSLLWLLLITFFIFSRVYGISKLPLFSDEAYAVARGWELKQTGELLGMIKYTTQPIFIWSVALFQQFPFNAIVDGRLVSGFFGLGTALILAKLAGKWISYNAEIPAFILMAVLPFSVFYDRTILFESTTLFFMLLALVFPVTIGLAILTKQTGWLVLPLALAVGKGGLKNRLAKILISVFAVMVVWSLAVGGIGPITNNVLAKTATPISASANFKNNLLRSKLWLIDYLTWPVIGLSIFGGTIVILETVKQKKFTPLLIVAVWTLGTFLFINKTAVIFYPRYLYSVLLGVVLLATKGWDKLGTTRIITIAVSLVVLIPSLTSSWKIITAPALANIPREDRFQFFEDWTSGVGSQQLVDEIVKIAGEEKINIYLEEENSYFVTLKSDKRLRHARVETVNWLFDPLTEIPEKIFTSKELSLFVRNRNPDIPADWPVELVVEVPKTDSRSVYLYRIVK